MLLFFVCIMCVVVQEGDIQRARKKNDLFVKDVKKKYSSYIF